MKILVTGGAGYIGSHAVYELIRSKYEVVVLDDLSTGNKSSIHNQAKFYEGNQLNKNILKKIFIENKIDAVMHFSAKLIVPESVSKPIEYFENNLQGLLVLLKEMKNFNIKKIVFSSTAAIYGDATNQKLIENTTSWPINPYGSSKLACEWLIKSVAQAHDFKYAIFRYFNVAGADVSGEIGQSTKNKKITHLIPTIIDASIIENKVMTVFGNDYDTQDGYAIRDYIHVSDLVKAHIKGLEYINKGNNGTFNLGSEKGYSVMEVIKEAQKLGLNVKYKIGPRRNGDPAILIANTKKAKNALNFSPKKTLKNMIESDLQWRKNKRF